MLTVMLLTALTGYGQQLDIDKSRPVPTKTQSLR